MIVVDASAVIEALVADPVDARLVDRLRTEGELCAPHLIDVEVAHALRRLVRSGSLSTARAEVALGDWLTLPVAKLPHTDLLPRAWQLRDSLTAYDAMYVALSERLGVVLVTCDARLQRARGHRAIVETYGAPPTGGGR